MRMELNFPDSLAPGTREAEAEAPESSFRMRDAILPQLLMVKVSPTKG
jgi:hypothetical protein